MDRRRALMAASIPSESDTGWSFTLPLVDVGENFEYYQLSNDEDSRISELFNLLVENSYFEPSWIGGTWFVNEEWLQENPIYINGDMLTAIYCDIHIGDDSNKPDIFLSYSPFFMDIAFYPDFIGANRFI